MPAIAIVGAGMAGLAAGRELARAGYAVTIFEKSRGLGGRVATRRVDTFAIDHGAQIVKAPTPATLALLQEAGGATRIERPVWIFDGEGRVSPGDPELNAEPAWTWPGGLTALARYLATGLEVRRETTVAALRREGACYVAIDAGGRDLGCYDAVLLTAPAPQSAAILRASAIGAELREPFLEALAPVRYRACLSLALAYSRRPEPPWYALLNADRRHPIAWLACEHLKPGRAPDGAGLLIAQMAPAWSEQYWEALPKGTYGHDGAALLDAATTVHELLRPLVGADLGSPLWVDVHRWRYALPDTACGPLALTGLAGLFVAGDMEAGQGRVHHALESGWRAAERIRAALAPRA